ncbi:glypican-5 isoform X1 [Pangasianodon hypophthalmus]|uniref:glypican-5 isoform X1 n=1 Tax=Pangasianodon hypophthalmus TaxID=310915 RepID=UPI00230821B3|nr:glypican-5 isoform X1 [Pangasianodon hypophthalmus]
MSRGLFPRVNVCWVAALLLAHLAVASAARAHTCSEVKTAFQLRQIGPLKWVPEAPATDVNLLVCKHAGPSCCTRKMEESYKVAAVRDTVQNIRSYSFELKYLLLGHAAAFQDTYQSLFTFSQGHLISLFESTYTSLSSRIAPHVTSLFSSLSNFIQDTSNISVDATVYSFYDHLFPIVHNHIIKPGIAEDNNLSECLRATRQDVNPFGHHAQAMVEELAGAMQAARALTRAFSMGEDLMNVTEMASLTSECAKALLKMQYCPHCQGLTLIRPCPEFCLNVMRGCLANVAELDMPWRHYVAILEDLIHTVAGEHSLELALLGVRGHVNEAILYAQLHEARISATVDKVCGQSVAETQSVHPTTDTMIPTVTLSPEPTTNQSESNVMKQLGRLSHLRSSLPLKPTKHNKDRSLKQIAREFMKYIERFKAFFAAVPEMLCEGEVVRDEPTCWSGNDVVESYKGRVVGNGIIAQRHNPEVRVRGPDAMLAAVKERLVHFNQEIQKHMPGLGHRDSWEDLGSGEDSSGECDDEDGCQGSGEGTTESSNTDSSVDTEVVVKSPPHEAPVGRFKPKLSSAAHHVLPSFTILILILGQQWTLN